MHEEGIQSLLFDPIEAIFVILGQQREREIREMSSEEGKRRGTIIVCRQLQIQTPRSSLCPDH